MAEQIRFVRNHTDLSTDKGFQFEFHCDRCGSGFRTPFRASATGTVSTILDAAGGLFGGLLGSAARVGDRVHDAAWERAHDAAFQRAVEEQMPNFIQCPRCSSWVCRESCWNVKRGLCKECAPDLGVEMSAAQSARSVQEVWAHARMADEDKPLGAETWKETVVATCPKCEAPLQGKVKFCPECGAPIGARENCAKCGAKLTPGAKFCPECGEKTGAE